MIRQEISRQIWNLKYRNGNESEDEYYKRIPEGLFDNEKQYETLGIDNIKDEVYNKLKQHKFSLAGRGMYAIGTNRKNQTFSNCFVIPFKNDSMESIMEAAKESAMTMKAGGGVGYSISILRPKSCIIKTSGTNSSGAVAFLKILDATCSVIKAGNSRRGAQLCACGIWHPDIEDYIIAKRKGDLSNFNLSVFVSDEFMVKLENDEDWDLVFPDINYEKYNDEWDGNIKLWKSKGYPIIVHKTLKARDLWNLIMESNYKFAEPGILFEDTINNRNTLYYDEYIQTCNPCFSGDTSILTDNGYVKFTDVVDKEINVWNGDKFSKVTPKVTGENQPTKIIELSNGRTITCTHYHKWILSNGEKIEAKYLSVGDKLYKTKFPVIDIGNDVDEKYAYTYGFFCGDGSIETNRKRSSVWLYGNKKSLLDDLLYVNYNVCGNDRYFLKLDDRFDDKTFVPNVSWSIKSRLDYLAGIIDSDGTLNNKGGNIAISSINKEYLNKLNDLLNTLGVSGSVGVNHKSGKRKMPNGKGELDFYNCKTCYRLTISASKLQTLIGLGLKTKRVKLTLNESIVNKERFVKITNISEGDVQEKVYCFTEPFNHTGVFNGQILGQCGEQPLYWYGSCNLAPINLSTHVKNEFSDDAYFDFEDYIETIKLATITLDKMLDISYYPLQKQKDEVVKKRLIGIGFTGLSDAMSKLKIPYNSKEAVEFTDKVSMLLSEYSYSTSADLAKLIGKFPNYDERMLNSYNVKLLSSEVQDKIKKYGLRNSRLTSIAPTGTTSLVMNNCSAGIEPNFALEYTRNIKDDNGGTFQELIENEAWSLFKNSKYYNGEVPDYFITAQDLKPEDHLAIQAAAQKWMCTSISKTINCPVDISFEEFKNVYTSGWKLGLKGCTTYRPNDIIGSVLEVKKEQKDNKKSTAKEQREFFDIWKDQVNNLVVYDNVSLPSEYPMKGYKIKSEGKKWYIHVAFKDKQCTKPFAIFVSTNNRESDINTYNAIEKLDDLAVKKGISLSVVEDNKQKSASQTNVIKICRIIGMLLRHNVQLIDIVKTLENVDVPITSFVFRIKKFLMSFIEEIPSNGVKCPECGEPVEYRDGCQSCTECFWSKCS